MPDNKTPGKSVVLCDDDKTLTDIVRVVMTRKGFRVYTAPDGAAALKLIRSAQPQLLLLDIDMPVKNGFQVMEELRAAGVPKPYTIIISGHEDAVSRDRAKELGADQVWTKPFNAAKLLGAVEDLVKQGRI